MGTILKDQMLRLLVGWAKKRLKKSRPIVVGVTGSVGKTTLKELLHHVLSKKYAVLKSAGNFNTELGLPLSVLQIKETPSSRFFWPWLLIKAWWNCHWRPFPYECLVLEYGVDKPGDMKILTAIAQPQIAIFTLIAPTHLEKDQFHSLHAIWKEKKQIAADIPADGLVIYNADDPLQKATFRHFTACAKIPYGKDGRSSVEADQIEESRAGLTFIVKREGRASPVVMPHVLGKYHARLACVPFALLGRFPKLTLMEVQEALREFTLPPGRMNLLAGRKNSIIIDSSYNASPVSMGEALEVLRHFSGRKIAALGQMNELGDDSQRAHEQVGAAAASVADILITVGKLGRIYAKTAVKRGRRSLQIYSFDNSEDAGGFLSEFIREGDVILVKGSQNKIRMEILIKKIMNEPEKAAALLVRQEKKWLK